MYTFLEDGQLRVYNNLTSNCSFRCLVNKGETNYVLMKWIKMKKSTRYHVVCEFVEVYCSSKNKTTFRYFHSQVLKSKSKNFRMEDKLHPSVVILMLDSTSSSNGLRAIVETVQVFRQYYDATTFYYHNKVGRNSRPNAYAIFTGRRIAKLDPKQFPGESVPEYRDSCTQGLLRNETITYDFIDQKYATFYAEDWINAFTWPNCRGYGENISIDHYSGAYMLRMLDNDMYQESKKYYSCRRQYHKIMEYFDQFLNKYNGIAKFAKIWLSFVSHDSINGLYHADKYFASFFRKQVRRLRNSFVFVTGDHGMRFGEIRGTEIGRLEDNNPLLLVAVPEYLRFNKQLIANLRLNARRHTPHYDLHATLYDIAHTAKRYNFETWNEINFRTCAEMEISDEFCICFQNWTEINTSLAQAQDAANVVITYINNYLNSFNASDICSKLSLKKVRKAKILEGKTLLQLAVKALPSNGTYETQLRMDKGKFELAATVYRTDEYGKQGNCMRNENIRPFCYCKKQHPKNGKKMTRLKAVQNSVRRRRQNGTARSKPSG